MFIWEAGRGGGGPDLVRLGSEALSDWANSVISGCFKRSIRYGIREQTALLAHGGLC